jgi:hypothetical protein
MLSVVKRLFAVKTKDTNFLKYEWKDINGKGLKDVKRYKLNPSTKMTLCNYFFTCFGRVPLCSKDQRRFHKILEVGEERLRKYVCAEHFVKVLYEHHNILKKLNTSGTEMKDAIYDFLIPVSTCDENEPEASAYYKSLQQKSMNLTALNDDVELEEWNLDIVDKKNNNNRGNVVKNNKGSQNFGGNKV